MCGATCGAIGFRLRLDNACCTTQPWCVYTVVISAGALIRAVLAVMPLRRSSSSSSIQRRGSARERRQPVHAAQGVTESAKPARDRGTFSGLRLNERRVP